MRLSVLAVTCGLLTACSDGAVKDAVREGLIDPESARFGEISYSDKGERACVEVNAKNRMGGYTGDKQMVVAKFEGEWTPIDDIELSHETCVELINRMEKDDSPST